MSMSVLKAFFLGFLVLNSSTFANNTFEKDQFLFKIIDEIYTLQEVKEFYFLLNDFKCINKDFLILKVLPAEFLQKTEPEKIFKVGKFSKEGNVFEVDQVYVFNILKRIIKLGTYVNSQNIELNKDLIKLNKQLAKENNCRYQPSNNLVSQSVFDRYWKMLMKIEVFLNVQFSSNSSSEDKTKIQDEKNQEIAFLIDSIEKQIKEVLFW